MTRYLSPILRRLSHDERGFTLIELLISMSIMGILMGISLPTYASFRDMANKTAAAASINAVVPDIEAYSSDNYSGAPRGSDPDWNGTDGAGTGTNADSGYSGLTFTILKNKYDSSIDTSKYHWNDHYTGSATDYCVYTTSGQWYAAKKGPSGTVTTGLTMVLSTCSAS